MYVSVPSLESSPFFPSHDSLRDFPVRNLMLPLPGFQTLSPFY